MLILLIVVNNNNTLIFVEGSLQIPLSSSMHFLVAPSFLGSTFWCIFAGSTFWWLQSHQKVAPSFFEFFRVFSSFLGFEEEEDQSISMKYSRIVWVVVTSIVVAVASKKKCLHQTLSSPKSMAKTTWRNSSTKFISSQIPKRTSFITASSRNFETMQTNKTHPEMARKASVNNT